MFLTFTPTNTHTRRYNLIRIPRKPSKFTCLVNIGLEDIAQVAHNKVLIAAGVSAAIGQLSKPFTSVILYGKDFDYKTALQAGGFPSTHSSSVVATATCIGLERGFSDSLFGLTLVYAGLVMYDAQGVRREVGNHAKALNTVLPKRQINSFVSKSRDDSIDSPEESTSTSNSGRLDSRFSEKARSSTSKSANVALLVTSDDEVKQANEGVASFKLAADDDRSSESQVNIQVIPLKESIGHTEVEVIAGALLGFLVSLAVYSIM
ncbi:Acid phosphatase/vanadium-dependent haloperoxidase-related protein [Corchorus olitorius]|uniref:Acid phosphatase/vanadium-dependent haloperoxidase-related protein n=1 Tax=Corchorus olitorius TaxID=93759 RepID=A0A1R3GZW5_9ROSI|nr:Acid phosphatase/vanadium-dependent haloperoxidase-related protein [Corchorus olitorius]